jgi:asparagine synthase (glutamine-hydrolysing)
MAGFVGICSNNLQKETTIKSVGDGLRLTVYSDKSGTADLVGENNFVLGKSFFPFLDSSQVHSKNGNVSAWLTGEIYNQSELGAGGFTDTLLNAYFENSLDALLQKVNGIYIAIIYDAERKVLQIITDRYGLKPLYIYHSNNSLILASELKCFPSFPSFNLKMRTEVIDCFMQLEHFLGNETWFQNVEVAAPSTIYTYTWENDKLASRRYWSWANIKKTTLTFHEAAAEMGELLDKVNKSRFISKASVGVALSGGLDSRAILAAVHQEKPVTYTFGTPASADVKIANRVTKMAGVEHIHYNTYTDHWLIKRFTGVWKTDGMLNMLHMHYSHLMNQIPEIMDINLSGFLGDAMLGGSYLEKKGKVFLNQRINDSIARHYYGIHFERCSTADSFFDLDKIDPYLLYNRGRRMIGMGAEEPSKTVPQRLPFMDIKLMDLSYSLPDEFRVHSKVYNAALLMKYPEFYRDIPHATTGVPISNDPSLFNLALKKYNRLLWVVKYKLGMQTSFINVQNWIKEPETAALLMEILNPKKAIYPNFTSRNFYNEFLMPHLNGRKNLARQVMGALTMEIWFQQVLNKKYLDAAQQP